MARVLIYAMNYAPEMVGVGRYTAEIGDFLSSQGHEVTVVTTPPHYPEWKLRSSDRPFRWRKERIGKQTVIRCPLYLHKKMGGLWRLIAPVSFAVSSAPVFVWRLFRDRPGVVLCIEPTLMAAPVLLLAVKLTEARTFLHVQDLEVDAAFAVGHLARLTWAKRAAYAFERWCLTRFDKIITISGKMAAHLVGKGVKSSAIEIIRNWVDLDQIKPLLGESAYRRELGLAEGTKVVLYSGTLGAKMGFETVLDAAERLRPRTDIKLVIAGDGPARSLIAARASSLPNLILLPFQPETRIGEFLGLADLHLLPQAADAADLVLPSKLGGMLASGRPILATASVKTEIAEFLGSAAMLTPPGDAAALAAGIARGLDGGKDDAIARERRLELALLLSKSEGLREMENVLTDECQGVDTFRARATFGADEALAVGAAAEK